MDRIHDIGELLQTGIDMMGASGYHNTSINDVIRAAGLPKGSFYYLYPDKKSFALAAIQRYGDQLVAKMQSYFSSELYSPFEAIRAYYSQSVTAMRRAGYGRGCFLGNMGQEMSDVDDDFRKLINRSFASVRKLLRSQFIKAQDAHEIDPEADPGVLADMVMNMWHGSLVRMKSSKSRKSLDIFLGDFFELLSCNV